MSADTQFEVVINAGDGYAKEHAELLRKQLLADDFHDHVVYVRPVDDTDDAPLRELHQRYCELEAAIETAVNDLRGSYRPGSTGRSVANRLEGTLESVDLEKTHGDLGGETA